MLDIARVTSTEALARLMQVAASHTASILNVSELAAPFQLSRPTTTCASSTSATATASRRIVVEAHDGDSALPFGDRLFAMPVAQLWAP